MTDKQKEAIETYEELKRNKEFIKNIDKDFFFEFGETVLNLIQIQQAEIDSLKDFKEIAKSKVTDLNPIGLARTNQLLSRQCHKLQEESEKKDKMIDLMAEYLASIDFDEHCVEVPGICIGCPKEDDLDGYMQCIKQYYERKVENEN